MTAFTVGVAQVSALVCDYLTKQGDMTPDEVQQLMDWFHSAGEPTEDIVAFLAQQGVLEPGCAQSMKMVRKGFLRVDAIAPYFNKKVADNLRVHLKRLERNTIDTLCVRFDSQRRGRPTVTNIEKTTLQGQLQRTTTATTEATRRSSIQLERPQGGAESRGSRTLPVPIQAQRRSSSTLLRPTTEIKVGTQLGKCILTEQIGKGGAGVVYRAIHQSLQITVAVKIIRHRQDNLDKAELEIEQLRTEARVLAQMNHPHVIRIFDFEEQPQPFLVLEYVEGLSLAELITQAGLIRYDRALLMMKHTALALQAAQHAGIIHRDIKPANLLINRQGTTKLADLGLAVIRHNSVGSVYSDGPVGTLAYMPPEQATASKADFRSDIYSLGATFYHAITGRTLFPCRSLGEALSHLVTGTPTNPTELVPGLDPQAGDVIMRMVAKDPAARFANYQELLDAFDDLLERATNPQPNRKTSMEINIDHSTCRFKIAPQTQSSQ